ncbi:zinc-binding alcohol dehydrogenase family protein [Streptomyces sp. NL15-2K]|uniref:zinc-binding alcohol dehydrogenase family protein n=1 Tax=Streptomyces sp. NL15-2K TaxID=376149 RepID=UPI000F58626A|nr:MULTISPECIES: zinc-binding alcohol dehydrogenase family protein [Actinomycetes]WKX13260.1 zinc-binding alcohol dehydrogenase family protein [Kutzneria buriramensis]
MKAAVVTTAGSEPEYRDFPRPEAGQGGQIVDLVASAIHPVVRAKASGEHYSSTGEFPLVPGVDAVARTADGTLVYTGDVESPWGTFAERMAVTLALPLPIGADPVAVAAGVNPGMSSWMPLTGHAEEHGTPDTVMILGVTGAAGGLAVQNALGLGVRRVIGVGRGADAIKRVAGLGAETVEIVGDQGVDAAAIGAAFDGKAPDLVLDFLWGGAAEAAFQALVDLPGEGSTSYAEIGSAAGEQATVPASLLRSRPFRLSGSGIGSFDMRRYFAEVAVYVQRIADGKVQVDAHAYPLSRVGEAWTAPAGPRPVLIAD